MEERTWVDTNGKVWRVRRIPRVESEAEPATRNRHGKNRVFRTVYRDSPLLEDLGDRELQRMLFRAKYAVPCGDRDD